MTVELIRLSNFDAVIEKLGGTIAVGDMIRKNSSYVTNWKRERGKIPSKYYVLFRMKLKRKGYEPSERIFTFVWPADIRKR